MLTDTNNLRLQDKKAGLQCVPLILWGLLSTPPHPKLQGLLLHSFIQACNDKYSCQQCLHMFYHCDKALTNNEVSKPHNVALWIYSPYSHSSSCFFHPHTDPSEMWLTGTFIKVEFTVVSKKSRWTITEVSPKSILTHGASCRHGWDPHPSIPNS